MTIIEDTIEIPAAPAKIFDVLLKVFSSQESYKKWHKDHIDCQWIKGKPFMVGSTLYIEEYLHGKLHKMKFLCTKVVPCRTMEYRVSFPMSIIFIKGTFLIVPLKDTCLFTATLSFRLGRLLLRFSKGKIDAIKQHMKEEGENLKKLIEVGF